MNCDTGNLSYVDKVKLIAEQIEAGRFEYIDNLTSTSTTQAPTANQVRILKGYIDLINQTLASDTPGMDTIQEIVNYAKENRALLESLGIADISGLQAELDAKITGTVIDNLTSTSITDPLSANQGKILQDTKIEDVIGGDYCSIDKTNPKKPIINVGNLDADALPTDLSEGTITSDSIEIQSSTGQNVVLHGATSVSAGLMASLDKIKVDNIAYIEDYGDVDNPDATAAITAAAASGKTVFFRARDYVVSSEIPQMAVGTSFIGNYGKTKIIADASFTAGRIIETNHYCLIADIDFTGDLPDNAINLDEDFLTQTERDNNTEEENTILQVDRVTDWETQLSNQFTGSLTAIQKFGLNSQISRVNIFSFSRIGVEGMFSQKIDGKMNNVYATNCGVGFKFNEQFEYETINSCLAYRNLYGTILSGGNNNFSAHKSKWNVIGLLLEEGYNAAHSEFVGGNFNSNQLFTMIANGISRGQSFTDVGFYHGEKGIYIRNSSGINIGRSRINVDVWCEGSLATTGFEGTNEISNSTFTLFGGTHSLHEDVNEAMSGKSNLILRDNKMLEANEINNWNNNIVNNTLIDIDGWRNETKGVVPVVRGMPFANIYTSPVVLTSGAFKIELPMPFYYYLVDLKVKIIDKRANVSSYINIKAYAGAAGTWYHAESKALSGTDYAIRFGHSDDKYLIYIGELNSNWENAALIIEDVTVYLKDNLVITNVKKEWKISLEDTAFQNEVIYLPPKANFSLLEGYDLNNLVSNAEVFCKNCINAPASYDGFLTVKSRNVQQNFQEYITVGGTRYTRLTNSGSDGWTAWA